MFRALVEIVRLLPGTPWAALARRATGVEARILPVPDDLEGLDTPWELPPPPGVARSGEAGATWMPVLGRVGWEVDPDVHASHDLLARWSRGRLREVLHAAGVAADRGDTSAARFAVERVEAFLARCPAGRCDHWRSGMEIGLRAMRLLHAASRLRSAATRPDLAPLARALELHERALESRLDWRAQRTGNHVIVALAARVVMAATLPRHPERERRLHRDAKLFGAELDRQVGLRGMHFESSTHYFLLVAECAAHAQRALASRGIAWRSGALDAIAWEALPALLRGDGTIASVGDGDDESFVPPSCGPGTPDTTRALELAAALGSGARPSRWSDEGLDVLTSGPLHATISSTSRGRAGTGGHGHDDATSYELWLGGPLLGHRGTGAYAADLLLRERLRSVRSHAALQVDAREMNDAIAGQAFRRRHRAHPVRFELDDGCVLVGHHGFAIPAPGAALTRTFRLDGDALVVEDEVTGAGTHRLTLRLPWAPGLVPSLAEEQGGEGVVLRAARGEQIVSIVTITSRGPDGRGLPLVIEHVSDTHWPRQGERVSALTTEIRAVSSLPAVIRHVVRPAPPEPPKTA